MNFPQFIFVLGNNDQVFTSPFKYVQVGLQDLVYTDKSGTMLPHPSKAEQLINGICPFINNIPDFLSIF